MARAAVVASLAQAGGAWTIAAKMAGMRLIAHPVMAIFIVATLGFWLGYFYWAYRMISGRKPGVDIFGQELIWNSFNICFRPSLLTDEGLRARKWFFFCFVGFPVCILIVWVLGGAFRSLLEASP